MTGAQKEIDAAFRLLSAIPVSGDHVEVMSAARQCLRRAFKLAEPSLKEEGGQDG